MPIIIVFFAVLFGLTGPAHAVDQQGAFAIKGIAAERCQAFSDAYTKREQSVLLFASWIDGYLTASNRLRENTFDLAPWQSPDVLLALINNHCARNPDDPLAEVVNELLKYLAPRRLTERSELETAKVGERSVVLFREVMRQVQEKLVEAGHLGGGVDGRFGPNTQTAIEAFQEANDLEKTGLPDQETLFEMFVEVRPLEGQ